MYKKLCDLCGATIMDVNPGHLQEHMGETYCNQCQATLQKVQGCGGRILKTASDVADLLKLKGINLRQEVQAFEASMIEDFLSTGRKVIQEHWDSLKDLTPEDIEEAANGEQ